MSDEPNKPRPDGEPAVTAAIEPEQENAEALASDVARLAEEVATLKGQIGNLTDRLLRAHADMDNLRKRAAKETEDMARYAIQKFAGDVVNVADNFERAINSVPAGASTGNAALQSLLDGVSMTEREFINVLERHGVKRIDPIGEIFNPHQHQAVMEAQNPSIPPGTIVQVFQMGYMIGDRVLRPAMVVVAKGGARQPKAPEPQAEPDTAAASEPPAPQHEDARAKPSSHAQPKSPDYDADDEPRGKPKDDIIL